jgi:hypothetical protein
MDLRKSQQPVDAYIGQVKEGCFPPLVNLARLTEEVDELAREINHRFGRDRGAALPNSLRSTYSDSDRLCRAASVVSSGHSSPMIRSRPTGRLRATARTASSATRRLCAARPRTGPLGPEKAGSPSSSRRKEGGHPGIQPGR